MFNRVSGEVEDLSNPVTCIAVELLFVLTRQSNGFPVFFVCFFNLGSLITVFVIMQSRCSIIPWMLQGSFMLIFTVGPMSLN